MGKIIFENTPQPTASTKYYVPLFDGVDITFGKAVNASLKETTNGDVEGWSVAVPGKYTFYLRKDLQLAYAKVFKPFSTLYLVGGCCAQLGTIGMLQVAALLPIHPNPKS